MNSTIDIINLGGEDFEIEKVHCLAGSGLVIPGVVVKGFIKDLAQENIDFVGFSTIHPQYFFELIQTTNNNYPLANLYNFKIHKLSPEWKLPSSCDNKHVFLDNETTTRYMIDKEGIVNSNKLKIYFTNHRLDLNKVLNSGFSFIIKMK